LKEEPVNRRQLLFSSNVVGLLSATGAFRETPRNRSVAALFLAVLVAGFLCRAANGQTNEWAWMNGTKTPEPSVYGTLGTPAAKNVPGNRSSALSWTDGKGNLWLFGGNGSDALGKYGFLNDLWEYSPATNQWVWMGGNSTLNGSMGAGIYIGAGVSGTLGTPAAGNIPEGRSDAVGWTDAKGNLWLFGGYNYGSSNSHFNDLWEFNPSTNQWAWMSGSKADSCSNCNQPGVYGNLGRPAVGNVPGSRMNALSWTDSKGNLWLFGGYGSDSFGVLGALNDLWEFNPSTNQWAWMGGSNAIPKCNTADCGQSGVYGTLGTPAAGNIPGARYSASGWSDSKGNFWLWGGSGFDSAGNDGSLNDLWEFNPSTNEWTWMSGISTYPANCSSSLAGSCGLYGAYGTLGMSSAGTSREPVRARPTGSIARTIFGSLAAMASTQPADGAISTTCGCTVLQSTNGPG
jgi:N-acetylneuraminic acid mutarotase